MIEATKAAAAAAAEGSQWQARNEVTRAATGTDLIEIWRSEGTRESLPPFQGYIEFIV